MKLTIGKKLSLAFGAVIALMTVSAVIAYFKIVHINQSIARTVEEAFPTAVNCQNLSSAVNRSVAALRGYVIMGDDAQQAKIFQADRRDAWTQIDLLVERLTKLIDGADSEQSRQELVSVRGIITRMKETQDQVENLAHTKANIPANQMLIEQAQPRSTRMVQFLTAIIDEELEQTASPERHRLLINLLNMRLTLTTAASDIRALLFDGQEEHVDSFKQAWATNQQACLIINENIDLLSANQHRTWQQLTAIRDEYEPYPGRIFELRRGEDWNRANNVMETQSVPLARQVHEAMSRLADAAQARVDKQRQELAAAATALTTALIAATVVAVVLGSIIALVLSRRIVSSIQVIVSRAQAIAEGDLSGQNVVVNSDDEVGVLAKTFNTMMAGLKDLTSQIRSVTGNINSASSQILAATKQQASGAKEQAATVQEITSTMQELTQSGRQISDRAKQVAASAETASTATNSGSDAARNTNQTMDSIRQQVEEVAENIVTLSEKTQTIGQIIATVNDIAEQSNLLALNASIEAASAGEQGGRFGVVANEMKNLADQAKESTIQVRTILGDIQKGINTAVMLTEEAVKRVESGKQQADVAEQTIREMGQTTIRSVEAFQQIAGGASQQQIGFDQVTQGMGDISSTAEQTAASTGQLESAVASLNALSKQLHTAVERYRLG